MRILTVVLFFLVTICFAQTKKGIVASDLMKIATTNNIQISPDGTKAALVVNRKAVKNENEYYYTRHLYVLDLTGKEEPRQLTFGDRTDLSPQWSPDGKQIAFVRTDGDKSQIWLLPIGGGEAHVLTKAEFGAGNARWSPDGKMILYTSSIPASSIEGKTSWNYERPGRAVGDEPNFKGMKSDEKKKVTNSPDGSLAEVRAWLAKNASDNNPRVLYRQDIQGEQNLQPDESFTHLFIKTLDDEKAVQLTNGMQDFNSPEWSPDGKTIICDSRVYEIHPDRETDSDIWTIDVATKAAKQLIKWPDYSLSGAIYSPDGTMITFTANTTKGRFYSQNMIATATASGEKPTIITQSLDRDAGNSVWSADSKTIYFAAQTEGDIPLFSIPAKGGTITKIYGNDSGVNDFDIAGDRIVCAVTETKNPWEVYLLSAKDSKAAKQITQLNEGWLKERTVVSPKEFWLTRLDGAKVQYWVMEPAGRKEGVKYPTILNIHGGPSAMWGPGIFSMWHEYQLENSWGYGLVYSNPRGSGGYGDKFKRANYQDWGTGPADDILSSLDEAVKNHSWIDKDQLFVEGGSYAGYMVAWIVGHDNRFKAANAQRGVYELSTFMGEGNAWRLVPEHFGGYPWDKATKQILDAQSPLTYVDKINTPLLIIHGDQDLRTGVIQSETLYKSLKILNKPVEYIRYPREGHELTRSGNPGRMMDHMLRVIEFFERYAKHPAVTTESN
ncbi:MAG TPA: S9 family peptidase [Cyclobacteriaceae bacterium]|nr:S9 family peptidase [Cyclobacteriaceae bacterium]